MDVVDWWIDNRDYVVVLENEKFNKVTIRIPLEDSPWYNVWAEDGEFGLNLVTGGHYL